MNTHAVMLLVLGTLGFLSLDCAAQTLPDVARQERSRQTEPRQGRVFTNENIPDNRSVTIPGEARVELPEPAATEEPRPMPSRHPTTYQLRQSAQKTSGVICFRKPVRNLSGPKNSSR